MVEQVCAGELHEDDVGSAADRQDQHLQQAHHHLVEKLHLLESCFAGSYYEVVKTKGL